MLDYKVTKFPPKVARNRKMYEKYLPRTLKIAQSGHTGAFHPFVSVALGLNPKHPKYMVFNCLFGLFDYL